MLQYALCWSYGRPFGFNGKQYKQEKDEEEEVNILKQPTVNSEKRNRKEKKEGKEEGDREERRRRIGSDFIIDKINNHALYKPNTRYEVLRRRMRRLIKRR